MCCGVLVIVCHGQRFDLLDISPYSGVLSASYVYAVG